MARVVETISVKMPAPSEFEALGRWFEALDEETQERFWRAWHDLEAAGAQQADVGFVYGVVHCWISDDFRQHCAGFGYHWPEVT